MSLGGPAYFHGSFTLTRTWRTTPARVFAAWADLEIKAQCFPGLADGWSLIRRELGGARARVSYTEQIVFLDGRDGTASRKRGTEIQWAALEAALLEKEAS